MSKSDVSRMEGSPWHVDCLKMDEWDSRRDKRVCAYFYQNHCKIHNERCIGSSHCPEYKLSKRAQPHKIRRKLPPEWHEIQGNSTNTPNVIQKNDAVTIFCTQTNQCFTFVIPDDGNEDIAPIKAQCIGKHLHDKVSWNGYQYEITGLKKVKY